MNPSVRQQIIEAYRTRLRAIDAENDFEQRTLIFVGDAPELGDGDPDTAIAIVVQDTEPRYQGENVFELVPVEIQALAKASLDEPYLAAETVLATIQAAIELPDRTLGGLIPNRIEIGPTRTVPREAGSLTVAIGVRYDAKFSRAWGRP